MLKDNGAKRWYWLITKHLVSRMDVLTICLGDDGEALAIFSFEEEALMYLHCHPRASEEGWRARQSSVGELVSVLYGPCSDTKKVVLDPLPRIGKKELVGLLRMHRSAFLRFLLRQEAPSHLHFVPSRSHGPRKVVSHVHVAYSYPHGGDEMVLSVSRQKRVRTLQVQTTRATWKSCCGR